MAIRTQSSFSTGELDPVLHDRTTLQKFQKGLATARNVVISKTASILSRPSRAHFIKSKNDDETIVLYSPPNSGVLMEWGDSYVRLYDFSVNLIADLSHSFIESDLENLHFATSGKHVYVFCAGKNTLKLLFDDVTPVFIASSEVFRVPASPSINSVTGVGSPSGYSVDYLVTYVINGEESDFTESIGAVNKPIAAGQSVTINVKVSSDVTDLDKLNEMRVYRRPSNAGAFGFIGSSGYFTISGSDINSVFEDFGGAADFLNGPPLTITSVGLSSSDIIDLKPKTGEIYQQRLLITTEEDEESILASRPGFQNNFLRDVPFSVDSALKFKSGTSGNARILRMTESDGLIIFTSVGIFASVGVLSVNNLALEKKGHWVIDENLPPLAVPGGVFFVDKTTNTVRQLVFSQDILSYQALDQTIFSNHLFRQKKIVSWSFQQGALPLIWVVFSDGSFASFTYDFEHELRAWTRGDSRYPVESCAGTALADSTFFVTNKDGNRYIETTLPRFVSANSFSTNAEADKSSPTAFMDGLKTTQKLLNDDLVGSDVFLLVPITSGDWEGDLTLTAGTTSIFTTGGGGLGEVGNIFKVFNSVDGSEVNLEVQSRTSDSEVIVTPSSEYPSDQATNFRMYQTFNSITSLDHLEGESVSIMVDGYIVASPNNDEENLTEVIVNAGTVTLPDGLRGSIVIVGRPITADVKTLNISTVEQSPVLIESINVNKLYIRVHETRGLYINNKFPEEELGLKDGSTVLDMQDLDILEIPSGRTIIGNRYKKPVSKRIEQTLPGSWDSGGEISIRQVDPLHFEILSIIPDLDVLRRSDR